MREHHVGALVVTATNGDGERAIGMLTDRDLVVDVIGRNLDCDRLTAGDVASRTLVSIQGEADVGEAIATMNKAGVRRLLVTGAHGEVAGIVSLDDLLESLAAQLAGLVMAMRHGVARETEQRPARIGQRRPVFLLRHPGHAGVGLPALQSLSLRALLPNANQRIPPEELNLAGAWTQDKIVACESPADWPFTDLEQLWGGEAPRR